MLQQTSHKLTETVKVSLVRNSNMDSNPKQVLSVGITKRHELYLMGFVDNDHRYPLQ